MSCRSSTITQPLAETYESRVILVLVMGESGTSTSKKICCWRRSLCILKVSTFSTDWLTQQLPDWLARRLTGWLQRGESELPFRWTVTVARQPPTCPPTRPVGNTPAHAPEPRLKVEQLGGGFEGVQWVYSWGWSGRAGPWKNVLSQNRYCDLHPSSAWIVWDCSGWLTQIQMLPSVTKEGNVPSETNDALW